VKVAKIAKREADRRIWALECLNVCDAPRRYARVVDGDFLPRVTSISRCGDDGLG